MALSLKDIAKRRPIGKLSAKEQALLDETGTCIKSKNQVILPWQYADDFVEPKKGESLEELIAMIHKHHKKIMKLEASLAALQAQVAQLKKK